MLKTSNSLESIERSNIITQELKIVEKSSIFDAELVTIENLNIATKLSKSIKKSKIIIQPPKKSKSL